MRVRNTALPVSRVVIDSIGDKTTISLWDGTYTEHAAVGDPEIGEQNAVEYEYSLYQLTVHPRPGLAEAIRAQFDDWYAAAMEQEKKQSAEREMKAIEQEMSQNIVNTLLDYDFRLMMLEELGTP